jgi:DnaJ domain
MIESFPLSWPHDKPRTPRQAQKRAKFGKESKNSYGGSDRKQITIAESVSRITKELYSFTKVGYGERIPRESVVISTNIKVGRSGFPLSEVKQPDDTGVALYFQLDKKNYCLPCDKWDRVADNLSAIAAHLGALRGIERWGVGETHDVFTGFRALPYASQRRNWWEVLGVTPNATWQECQIAYTKRAKEVHPDKPTGSTAAFQELEDAWVTVEKHLK